MSEQLGPTLVRLRQREGYTQLRVAEALCAASGVATVTRQEVARWERQERVPSAFWLGWLGVVLEVPMTELEGAATVDTSVSVAASGQPDAGNAGAKDGGAAIF